MEKEIIFQIDSHCIKESFCKDNFKIELDENQSTASKTCVIYFSSNEIYYPNTELAFRNAILNRDKYEWSNNRYPQAYKHIFLRDIRKQWYIGGINDKLDDPIKVLNFLQSESKGLRVITVGSSAGGYAAILFGSMLNAERVYAFNSQFNLFVTISNSNHFRDPLLFKSIDNSSLTKFYNLSSLINNKTKIFYFQSSKSKLDVEQFDSLNIEVQKKIHTIRFNTSNHGFPFLRQNIKLIFSLSEGQLIKMSGRSFIPILYSIKYEGILLTLYFILKLITQRIKKKLIEFTFRYYRVHRF